jgi:hypothetical protein
LVAQEDGCTFEAGADVPVGEKVVSVLPLEVDDAHEDVGNKAYPLLLIKERLETPPIAASDKDIALGIGRNAELAIN